MSTISQHDSSPIWSNIWRTAWKREAARCFLHAPFFMVRPRRPHMTSALSKVWDFYRWSRSCRPDALARIGQGDSEFADHWLAGSNVCKPSAINEDTRRFQRPMLMSIELTLSPQPSSQPPLVRPRPGPEHGRPRAHWQRRSNKWACLRAVEVEHVLETPSHLSPEAAPLFAICRRPARNEAGQPMVREIGSAFLYSSQRIRPARTTPTIKTLGFRPRARIIERARRYPHLKSAPTETGDEP